MTVPFYKVSPDGGRGGGGGKRQILVPFLLIEAMTMDLLRNWTTTDNTVTKATSAGGARSM